MQINEIQSKITIAEDKFEKEKQQQMQNAKRKNLRRSGFIDPIANIRDFRTLKVVLAASEWCAKGNWQEQKEDAEKEIRELRQRIDTLTSEISSNTTYIEGIEQAVHALKLKKSEVKIQLKQLYVRMLNDEEQLM